MPILKPAVYVVSLTEGQLRCLKANRRAEIWSSTRRDGALQVVFRARVALEWYGETVPQLTRGVLEQLEQVVTDGG